MDHALVISPVSVGVQTWTGFQGLARELDLRRVHISRRKNLFIADFSVREQKVRLSQAQRTTAPSLIIHDDHVPAHLPSGPSPQCTCRCPSRLMFSHGLTDGRRTFLPPSAISIDLWKPGQGSLRTRVVSLMNSLWKSLHWCRLDEYGWNFGFADIRLGVEGTIRRCRFSKDDSHNAFTFNTNSSHH